MPKNKDKKAGDAKENLFTAATGSALHLLIKSLKQNPQDKEEMYLVFKKTVYPTLVLSIASSLPKKDHRRTFCEFMLLLSRQVIIPYFSNDAGILTDVLKSVDRGITTLNEDIQERPQDAVLQKTLGEIKELSEYLSKQLKKLPQPTSAEKEKNAEEESSDPLEVASHSQIAMSAMIKEAQSYAEKNDLESLEKAGKCYLECMKLLEQNHQKVFDEAKRNGVPVPSNVIDDFTHEYKSVLWFYVGCIHAQVKHLKESQARQQKFSHLQEVAERAVRLMTPDSAGIQAYELCMFAHFCIKDGINPELFIAAAEKLFNQKISTDNTEQWAIVQEVIARHKQSREAKETVQPIDVILIDAEYHFNKVVILIKDKRLTQAAIILKAAQEFLANYKNEFLNPWSYIDMMLKDALLTLKMYIELDFENKAKRLDNFLKKILPDLYDIIKAQISQNDRCIEVAAKFILQLARAIIFPYFNDNAQVIAEFSAKVKETRKELDVAREKEDELVLQIVSIDLEQAFIQLTIRLNELTKAKEEAAAKEKAAIEKFQAEAKAQSVQRKAHKKQQRKEKAAKRHAEQQQAKFNKLAKQALHRADEVERALAAKEGEDEAAKPAGNTHQVVATILAKAIPEDKKASVSASVQQKQTQQPLPPSSIKGSRHFKPNQYQTVQPQLSNRSTRPGII